MEHSVYWRWLQLVVALMLGVGPLRLLSLLSIATCTDSRISMKCKCDKCLSLHTVYICVRDTQQAFLIFGRPFVKRFALCYQSVVCLSVCNVGVLLPNGFGWIKMKLGMEVGFGPSHIVLDEDPSPKQGGQQPPLFCPCLLWPNGWMDQDATWYGGRHRPWPHCFRWRPSFPPPKKRMGIDPNFRPMSIVAKRSPISAIAEHLYKRTPKQT